MLRVHSLIIAVVFGIGTAAAEDVQGPQWLERPAGEAFMQFYPEPALYQGVVGRVLLDCFVNLDTTATCSVVEESPIGWQFGEAALAMARSFRLAPATRNGEPTRGGRIRVPLRFTVDQDWQEKLPPELEQLLADVQPTDLPLWDEAPNYFAVRAATPPAALVSGSRGRGVLSCRVNVDRRLACELLTDAPAGQGFGQAAMELARSFRVADEAFAAQHRINPFLLPVNFGGAMWETPLSTHFAGVGPLTLNIPSEVVATIFPAAARAARRAGEASVICTLGELPPADCVIERETPSGWGFGLAVLDRVRTMPLSADSFLMIPGDQIRFEATFQP
ncbi:MAG: energy transducer TonB [Hyphomonadaceae bacterium]|nr:energy transducer TonB [Hyphomonadaceae bacterium]